MKMFFLPKQILVIILAIIMMIAGLTLSVYQPVSNAQSSTPLHSELGKSKIPKPLRDFVDWLKDYFGNLRVVSTSKPQLLEGESLLILKGPDSRPVYTVLSQDQLSMFQNNHMTFYEHFRKHFGEEAAAKLKITIKCEGSWSPPRLSCTITISW
ncbi:MAG: hypothetical protein ACRCXZ_08610 [Patescibacteria group bacterium]